MQISIEAYRNEQPLWYVTRYRIGEYFHSDPFIKLYFEPQNEKYQLTHQDIRLLLAQENWKYLQASHLNYTSYFAELQQKVDLLLTSDEAEINDRRLHYEGENLGTFMQKFSDLTIDNLLEFPHPERVITNAGKPVIWDTIFVDDAYSVLSYNRLNEIMEFDDFFLNDLRLKHKIVTSLLPTGECPFYSENGSGYVLIGGSTYSWYSLLAIQSLHKAGSKLPVELVLPDDSSIDESFCKNILPLYNAKCITLEEIYPKQVLKKLNARGYQLKALAILASSFEKVMYLDSDVLAVENPDRLFDSELFKKYGMITWPDFWRRTGSPKLYEALEITLNFDQPIRFLNDYFTPSDLLYRKEAFNTPKNDINFHDLKGTLPDWSTEAGLLLVNKKTHFQSLLLALYYNINGPSGYYPLLSQGGAGEGDKETWPMAAHALNQTWWQVNKQPDKTYGTWIKNLNWIVDSCIVQVDPLEDWEGVLGLTWTQEHWRKEMIDRGGYVYNYDYSFGKMGYEYAGVMGASLGNGGMASFAKDGADSWTPMYPDDDKYNHYPVPMLTKPRDMFYHLHSPKLDPWDYILDDLFSDRSGSQMRNFGDIWTRLGWDLELWIWETVREDMCDGVATSVNGLHAQQLDVIRKGIRTMKCFSGRDFESICKGEGRRLDKRIEWLQKDGAAKLEKSGRTPGGWKLVGTERERIKAIVENNWNHDR